MENTEKWISADEYQEIGKVGPCWIVYKGRIRGALMDERGFFLFSEGSKNCFMTECITGVIPIVDSMRMPNNNGIKTFQSNHD